MRPHLSLRNYWQVMVAGEKSVCFFMVERGKDRAEKAKLISYIVNIKE